MFFENEIPLALLPWNTLFRSIGLIAGLLFFAWQCRQEKVQLHWSKAFLLFAFFWIVGLAGARLLSLIDLSFTMGVPLTWDVFFQKASAGMLRWYGSMLLFALLLPWLVKTMGKGQRWKVFDLFCLALCLFIVSVKQGCQFAGDGCYGVPTTLPWGMYYASGLRPSLLPVHPTPIYDSLFHFLLLIFLVKWRRQHFDGQTGLLFFMASSAFCFLLEFIRTNQPVGWGLTLAQWTYFAVLMVAGLTFLLLKSYSNQQPPIPSPNLREGMVAVNFH